MADDTRILGHVEHDAIRSGQYLRQRLNIYKIPSWYCSTGHGQIGAVVMKVLSSLKSAKSRHRDCKIVRRRGKVFVICKSNPRFKARQR